MNQSSDTATTGTATVAIRKLEADNTLSMLAVIASAEGKKCGWITGRAFQEGQVNLYHVPIFQVGHVHTLTSSRPVSVADVDGYRGDACAKYNLGLWMSGSAEQLTSMPIEIPDFPVDRFRITAAGNTMQDSYYYEWTGSQFPVSLEIPQSHVSGACSPSLPRLESISINGPADVLTGYFSYHGSNVIFGWIVNAMPETHIIDLPAIPDSILNVVRPASITLWAAGCDIGDFDTVPNYDDYINFVRVNQPLRGRNAIQRQDGDPEDCLYNAYFEASALLYQE